MDHDDSTENFGSSIIPVDEVHKNFDDSAEIFGSSTRPAYGMSYNIYIICYDVCLPGPKPPSAFTWHLNSIDVRGRPVRHPSFSYRQLP